MNKIQRTFLFALLICMILLTGCVSDNEQIKAPETLKITADLPENYPKALSKYKVDWYVQDDETAIAACGVMMFIFSSSSPTTYKFSAFKPNIPSLSYRQMLNGIPFTSEI